MYTFQSNSYAKIMLEESEPASTESGVALQNVKMQFRPGLRLLIYRGCMISAIREKNYSIFNFLNLLHVKSYLEKQNLIFHSCRSVKVHTVSNDVIQNSMISLIWQLVKLIISFCLNNLRLYKINLMPIDVISWYQVKNI